MSGSLGKVEKQLGGFGDNVDLSHLQDKLQVAQKEFTETGKVSEDSFRKLEAIIVLIFLNSTLKLQSQFNILIMTLAS